MRRAEVLTQLSAAIHEFVKDQYDCWREKLVPALAEESIRVRSFRELKPEARKTVEDFYLERVEPLMTPVTVDPAHPFPRVLNKALCMAFLLQKRRKNSPVYLGVVTVPRALPRVFRIAVRRRHHRIHFSARHRATPTRSGCITGTRFSLPRRFA